MAAGTPRITNRLVRTTLIGLAIIAIPAAVAVAGHRFGDVPSSHVFHDDITWLADQGITRGCNPPANTDFCPDDPVTRAQMAAFMRRFATTMGSGGGSASVGLVGTYGGEQHLPHDSWVTLATLNVTAPSAGAIAIGGTAAMFADVSDGALGVLGATLNQSCADGQGPNAVWSTLALVDSPSFTGVLPVPGGTSTVRLCAVALHVNTSETTLAAGSSLTALWVPSSQVSLQAEGPEDQRWSEVADRLANQISNNGG